MCRHRLTLANRLVGGLDSERTRWARELDGLFESAAAIVGDAALAAAFLTYAAPFPRDLRLTLWHRHWAADLVEREIPHSSGVAPLDVLTTDAELSGWMAQRLPVDACSFENAAVVCSPFHTRWPLLVDPQMQACVGVWVGVCVCGGGPCPSVEAPWWAVGGSLRIDRSVP